MWSPSKRSLAITREALKRMRARWKPLRPHPEQSKLWRSKARFKITFAGRRSGKSEIAKRDGAIEAFSNVRTFADYPFWVIFAGPTGPQMKNLYWEELTQNLIPQEYILRANDTDLRMRLWNDVDISVVSLEKGMRTEGRPIDRFYGDEFQEVKASVWKTNIRPALSTEDRYGRAWMYGVPRGGRASHFHQVVVDGRNPDNVETEVFHWTAESVLGQTPEGQAEIEQAKRDLDPRTYAQEYQASFQSFAGRAYYTFSHELHAAVKLEYDPKLPLVFMFDFNRSPGIAAVGQEQNYKGTDPRIGEVFTAIIDEVWIPHDSNTRRVCEALVRKYGKEGLNHQQDIYGHGDATGGIKGTAIPYDGTDWTEIDQMMRMEFGTRWKNRVTRSNPLERVRVNALNARLLNTEGVARMLVCPVNAPHVCDDLDSVLTLEGTNGELDKESDKMLTHLSDAVGYYVAEDHPMGGPTSAVRYG